MNTLFQKKILIVIIFMLVSMSSHSQNINNLNYYKGIYIEEYGIRSIDSYIIEQLSNSNLLVSNSLIDLKTKFDDSLILRLSPSQNSFSGKTKLYFNDSSGNLVFVSESKGLVYSVKGGFKKTLKPFENYKYIFDDSLERKYKHVETVSEASSNSSLPKSTTNENSSIEQQKSNITLSDVDINIPTNSCLNANTFVVIIGNENYQNEIPVKYASNDASILKEYFVKTLGVPSEQIHLVIDASYGKILREIEWIKDVAKVYEGEAKVIFYYAGHGIPDEKTKSAYILPVDGEASTTITAIKLEDIYISLNEYQTKQATIIVDACFSGAARGGMLATGRGIGITPKEDLLKGNLVVFSAVSEDETAHPYESKTHGLFTYYLMKKIQESEGDVTYGELSNYIKKEVSRRSIINGKKQTPRVNVSFSVTESWQDWTFK